MNIILEKKAIGKRKTDCHHHYLKDKRSWTLQGVDNSIKNWNSNDKVSVRNTKIKKEKNEKNRKF